MSIAPPLPLEELEEISLDVVRRNYALLEADLWVTQRVSRGAPVELGGFDHFGSRHTL